LFLKLVQSAATDLAGGTNGDDSDQTTALIGDATEDPKTGMQALDDPLLNIGIALVPGVYTQAVQNALITLAETTQNFLALVAPPLAVGTVQNAIDWSNGKSSSTAGSRNSAINSSYAAIYWPHVKIFSTFDGKDRFLDPTIFAARQMAYTDAVADSWFAPAGFRRGRLTKPSETEVKLNQGDRDSLYSGGNVINPIVNFPQQGITIFGQRTTQRNPTALDRINVRRLMIYIRKIILLSTQRFVFEPNDEFTWAEIEGVLNPFLDDIRRRRGITEFRVVCDETVNTPIRVDRNELWTKVLVKPTKTAEILIFEINLTNQSAQLGNL
jgi:phage tail sheath protein FI